MPFILVALSLLFETCIILGDDAGTGGATVKHIAFGLFGLASHAICISALLTAFFFRELEKKGVLKYKSIMAFSLCLALSALNSLAAQDGMRHATLSFTEFFKTGAVGESGGVFGSFIALLLSRLLTPTVATVVTAASALVLITFTVGTSRLGIWRLMTKTAIEAEQTEKPQNSLRPAPRPSLPDVTPSVINTVANEGNAQTLPELSGATQSELIGQAYDAEEDFSDEDFDEINNSAFNTVDFSEQEKPTYTYTPTDLMEEFGFNKTEAPKVDIYDEAPKTEKKPAVKKKPTTGGGISYSPFATIKTEREVFGAKSAPKTEKREKASPEGAYSPFADPFRSLEEKKSRLENENELWDEIKRSSPTEANASAKAPSYPSFEANSTSAFDGAKSDISPFESTQSNVSSHFESSQSNASFPFGSSQSTAPQSFENNQVGVSQPLENNAFEAPTRIESTQAGTAPSFENKPKSVPLSFGAQSNTVETETAPKPVPSSPLSGNEKKPERAFAGPLSSSAFDDDIETPEQSDGNEPYDGDVDPRVKNPFGIYNKLRYPKYAKPPTDLLDPVDTSAGVSTQEIYETQSKLHSVFENFRVDASVTGYSVGPSITRYEITPGPGVKAKQITGLGEDIALALQAENRKGDIRIVTVQGKSVMGVEVPNSVVTKVSLRSLIENRDFQNAKSKITVCIGLTVSGKPIFMNIDDMPHVLVAGQTKSGKSVAINCMIISLIYRASPDEVQLLLIDPKRVELSIYNDIPHMVMPVIDDPKRAAAALKWAVAEMERRYELLNQARVRNRDEYYATRDQNPKFEYMPQIVIIIDELADLMLQVREHVEGLINRLAAMARACGMHIVIGTQRPSVDVVTGLIKANIPSHIAFKVSSQTDSRVILGNVGAEKLLGRGDMLYHPTGGNQIRAQGAFVDTPEIKRILNYIIEKNGKAEYDPEVLYALQNETDKLNKTDKKSVQSDDDFAIDCADVDFEYLCQAIELVINMGKATTNVIQRHLKIGFNRAANLVEKLEELGFVSPPQGSKPRDVLVDYKTYQEWKNNNGK